MAAWENVASRVGKCVVCGMSMRIKHPACKTCSPKCRKALSRKHNLAGTKDKAGMRINGVWYPAEVLNMFSQEEIDLQTK